MPSPWNQPVGQAVADELSPAPVRESETLLLVEVETETRILAEKALAGVGYRVLSAANADEAMALSGRHSGAIHLLLTAVLMPGMSGHDLATRLKLTHPEMRVLFTTGLAAETLAARTRQILGERRTRASVLVVDDESGVRKLLRKVLESAGYSVMEAANGREALCHVRHQPVDLVLTDLVMPEKEGLETIRELRSLYPALRVIAMSGAFEGRYLKIAAMMGARATMKKPIAPDELLRQVEKVLAGRS